MSFPFFSMLKTLSREQTLFKSINFTSEEKDPGLHCGSLYCEHGTPQHLQI